MREQLSSSQASIGAIAEGLQRVLRLGIRPAKLRQCDDLLSLRSVDRRAKDPRAPEMRAFALEEVLLDALRALGDGPYGRAACLLFGAATDAKGRPPKVRRELAADELGVMRSTFRQNYEDDLVLDVAAEVLRIEVGLANAA